ncbi:MAG: uncharacterized protein JWQ19_1309 [Subtercola sp.]|nr:uncharacterized protein [Subtercola sp.]
MNDVQTASQSVARAAHRISIEGLTPELRADVRRRVLDLVGNSIAASEHGPARSIGTLIERWSGREEATAIGAGRFPAASAALLNGTLAHSLDFDDTHLPSVLHPSSSVIPAALATAERVGASGSAFLDAAGMGIEIVCRLGMAGYDEELGNSVFFERGQHATAICGAVGAAVAVGMLLGQDIETLTSTIGIAASMGSGILEANRTGGTVKRIHCGWAAHAGITAAEMASAGISGPPTSLEGRFGFFQSFLGTHFDITAVTDGLGERWLLPDIFIKPYPSNHFTHAGIDAALRMKANGIDVSAIKRLVLEVPTPILRTIAEPRADKIAPQSGYHAAFSGPYTVAAALTGGGGLGVFHDDFTDARARDPERLALAALVECIASQECDDIFPYQFPAILTAELFDGTRMTERVLANRGGSLNPLSTEEIEAKFHFNSDPVVGRGAADSLAGQILALGDGALLPFIDALTGAFQNEKKYA